MTKNQKKENLENGKVLFGCYYFGGTKFDFRLRKEGNNYIKNGFANASCVPNRNYEYGPDEIITESAADGLLDDVSDW